MRCDDAGAPKAPTETCSTPRPRVGRFPAPILAEPNAMTAAFVLTPEDSALASQPPAAAPLIRRETAADAADIEALLDHAFGPGRFAKASERVREFAPCAWTSPSAPRRPAAWWAACASRKSSSARRR